MLKYSFTNRMCVFVNRYLKQNKSLLFTDRISNKVSQLFWLNGKGFFIPSVYLIHIKTSEPNYITHDNSIVTKSGPNDV